MRQGAGQRDVRGKDWAPLLREFAGSLCAPFALRPLSARLQDADAMLEVTWPLCDCERVSLGTEAHGQMAAGASPLRTSCCTETGKKEKRPLSSSPLRGSGQTSSYQTDQPRLLTRVSQTFLPEEAGARGVLEGLGGAPSSQHRTNASF